MFTYRLDLQEHEIEFLKSVVEDIKNKYEKSHDLEDDEQEKLFYANELLQKVNNPKKIKYSGKKGNAAEHATEVRTKRAKKKIQNAINILRMENKKLTHYSIAKTAGVSYTTVKKYISLDEMK
jgi:hypothetical protein